MDSVHRMLTPGTGWCRSLQPGCPAKQHSFTETTKDNVLLCLSVQKVKVINSSAPNGLNKKGNKNPNHLSLNMYVTGSFIFFTVCNICLYKIQFPLKLIKKQMLHQTSSVYLQITKVFFIFHIVKICNLCQCICRVNT